MPYPTESCTNKHDLVTKHPLPINLKEEMRFATNKEVFEALDKPLPNDLKALCSVYSYPDGPKPPMSRGLIVIGVADISLSLIQKIISEYSDVPIKKCTITVKKTNAGIKLPPKDINNSTIFVKFMTSLARKELVAVVGKDKCGRFGILQPMDEDCGGDPDSDEQFAAYCYVGDIEEVKSSVDNELVADETTTGETTGGEFWQPPGATDAAVGGGGAEFSWVPPTGDDDESPFVFQSNGENDSWQPAAPSLADDGNSNKRKFDEVDTSAGDDDNKYHADTGAAAADKFYSGLTRSLDTRSESRIFHMRAFNGWVKATQIQELDPKTSKKKNPPLRVLDLACGKAGDLGKWLLHHRGMSNYVGIDVARGSLKDAALRARQQRRKLARCTFTCSDLGSDVPGRYKNKKNKVLQKLLSWSLQDEDPSVTGDPTFEMVRGGGISLDDSFDIVSIQFAIHYMMSSLKRARRFFQTVSELLAIGGNLVCTTIDARVVMDHLMGLGYNYHEDAGDDELPEQVTINVGGGACSIRFEREIVKKIFHQSKFEGDTPGEDCFGLEYTFTLREGSDHASGVGEAVDLPEWLTPLPVLTALAKEAGLELDYAHNFHEFYEIRKDPSANAAAHSALYNMKVLNQNGSISKEEWEISRLYAAIKFKKVSEPTYLMTEDDDGNGEEEEDDEAEDEVDTATSPAPVVDQKLYFRAMMKARNAVGKEQWSMLSPEEQKRQVHLELDRL